MTDNDVTQFGFRALADAQRTLPESRIASLTEGDIQFILAGEGSPPVVLISGYGAPFPTWALVWGELASTTTVFAYNRLGVGGSAPPREPQTATAVICTLRKTLAFAVLEPPYVLVAHALGGLYAQHYARRFPQEVCGVVLVESAHHEDDVHERRLRFLPPSLAKALTATAVRRGTREVSEIKVYEETATELPAAGPFPDIPLSVVTAGRVPSKLTTSRAQAERHDRRQRHLATLSPRGTQLRAPRSGNLPQISDPALVVRATRQVLVG